MGPRRFSSEELRVARRAQDALRTLLGRGEAPTPEAFTRAYRQVAGDPSPDAPPAANDDSPRPGGGRPDDALVRRLAALLSATLSAWGSTLAPESEARAQCTRVASRLVVAPRPHELLDDVERLLVVRVDVEAPDALPWRAVCLEALRHVAAMLPADSESASTVQHARAVLARAAPAEDADALARVLRVLRRSVLSG